MKTKLILIRHGETGYTAQKRYCGHVDEPLSAKGKEQARGLRKKLIRFAPSAAYASDLKRAAQTAELALRGIKAVPVRGLREMNFGALEGLTRAQALAKFPARYAKWLKDPSRTPVFPRAENESKFKTRVVRAFERIVAANKGGIIAVFSHGGPISAFLAHITKTDNIWSYLPAPTGISVVEYLDDEPRIKSLSRTKRAIWKK